MSILILTYCEYNCIIKRHILINYIRLCDIIAQHLQPRTAFETRLFCISLKFAFLVNLNADISFIHIASLRQSLFRHIHQNMMGIFLGYRTLFYTFLLFIILFICPFFAYDYVVRPSPNCRDDICEFDFELDYIKTMMVYDRSIDTAFPVIRVNGRLYKREVVPNCTTLVPITRQGK